MTVEKLFNYYGWTGHHILCSIIKINYNNNRNSNNNNCNNSE